MILADTSVWIDHFRSSNSELAKQLNQMNILMHPYIVAELSLGLLSTRSTMLAALDQSPAVRVARLDEVRQMIENHSLYGRGIGLTDAHLIASTLIIQDCLLWTKDKELRALADSLHLHVNIGRV